MSLRETLSITLLAAAFAMAAVSGMSKANAAGAFTLSSSSFKDGGALPIKHAASKSNPNCVGENISPSLAWTNPPDGTKSFALMIYDVDGRPPSGFVHFVAYGIPASVTGFAEGDLTKSGEKFVAGANGLKQPIFFGPCPPPGAPHHYVFSLMATDLEPSALKQGLTRDELVKALEGHVKGATSLVATFQHP